MHVAQFLALCKQWNHLFSQRLQYLSRIADQLHLHTLVAAAASALIADAVIGTRRTRQRLADVFQQWRQVFDLARIESHRRAAACHLAEPRIQLGDVVLLAIGFQEIFNSPDLLAQLFMRVRAFPLVLDEGLVTAIAAEHVDLGQLHRHQADRTDQHDTGHAPAAMGQRPCQHLGVAALQPRDHTMLGGTIGGVFIRADSIGIKLIASSHEASNDTEMVIAICAMNMLMLLVSPNRFGTNTMQ